MFEKKRAIPVVFIIIAALSGCLSHYSEDGSITINIPGAANARSIVEDDEVPYLRHDIALVGPGGTITQSITGTSVTIQVAPGDWNITVDAYGNKNGDLTQTEIVLRARGTADVLVQSGRNANPPIKMITTTEVTTWDDLIAAVDGAPYQDREEHIIIKNDLTVRDSFARIKRRITLLTDGKAVTISRDPDYGAQFFYIDTNGCLTLGKEGYPPGTLILDGNKDFSPSIQVNQALITLYAPNSELIMNDGTVLQNNNHNYSSGSRYGGGISMQTTGTCIFTMNGGVIRNNMSAAGGGVNLNASSGAVCTFIMNGGSIIGNAATSQGGGVYMYGNTTGGSARFIMNGGQISGNSAYTGGGLYHGGDASSFEIIPDGISGNTATALDSYDVYGGS